MERQNVNGKLVQMPFPEVSDIEKLIRCFLNPGVKVDHVRILRHRDFSVVARVFLKGGETVIYKAVLAPWDLEADIVRSVAFVPNTPRILGVARGVGCAQIVQEDVGLRSLRELNTRLLAQRTGDTLARIHTASGEFKASWSPGILRLDSAKKIAACFHENALKLHRLFPAFDEAAVASLVLMGGIVADMLDGVETGLQHGDAYAENIVLKGATLDPCFIDWSYFCFVGPMICDLASLVSGDAKNGSLIKYRQTIIASYAKRAGLSVLATENLLPAAYRLLRLLFLRWLLVRVEMGIMQTTVGPVAELIQTVVGEILC